MKERLHVRLGQSISEGYGYMSVFESRTIIKLVSTQNPDRLLLGSVSF